MASECSFLKLWYVAEAEYSRINENFDAASLIKSWLQMHIPEWINLQLVSQAKYLGIHIGPKLGGKNWEGPMAKFMALFDGISRMRAPLSYAGSLFQSRALSKLLSIYMYIYTDPSLRAGCF